MYTFQCTYFCFLSEAPGLTIVTVDIQATSITVRWTKPTGNGGSPITAYRVLILRGEKEIRNENITKVAHKQKVIGGLTISTNYTLRVFARNFVFEGNFTEKKIQTKFQGKKICICSKNYIMNTNFTTSIPVIKCCTFSYARNHKHNYILDTKRDPLICDQMKPVIEIRPVV